MGRDSLERKGENKAKEVRGGKMGGPGSEDEKVLGGMETAKEREGVGKMRKRIEGSRDRRIEGSEGQKKEEERREEKLPTEG